MKHGLAAAGLGLLAVLCACGSGAAQRTPHVPAAPAGTATVLLGFANAAGGAAASSLGATDLSVRIVTPKQATRRIEPGEIPDGVWLGQLLTAAADSWRISGLPAGQQLLVQVGFALPGAAAPAMPAANRALLHFPVMVGERGLDLDVQVSVARSPAGGYLIVGRLRHRDGQGPAIATRLDYGAGTVARDGDGDGNFDDEPQLADPQQLGISLPLLERLADENLHARSVPALFTAALESADATTGELQVRGLTAAGAAEPALPVQTLYFAEDSSFTQRHVSPQLENTLPIQPRALASGGQVTLLGSWLTDRAGNRRLWVERAAQVQLDLPPDAIVAVPLKEAARAGEMVPVTVYVNRTARPLHAVEKLRISFDAGSRYVEGSLDPGDRGGGAADGIWAGIGSADFELQSGTRTAASAGGAPRAYLELSLRPATGGEVPQATGALCNFMLACHADTALGIERGAGPQAATAYAGLDGVAAQWLNCLAATTPQVAVSGDPLLLSLEAPPKFGLGKGHAPYLVPPGARLQFRLIGPAGTDVTQHRLTRFTLNRNDAPVQELSGGEYVVPADYRGPLHVGAHYDDLYCLPASEVYLYVEDAGGFNLRLHGPETFIGGGSAQGWQLDFDQRAEGVDVRIVARGAQALHALYFDLNYDPRLYRPVTAWALGNELQQHALVPPPESLAAAVLPGRLSFGLCEVHPELGAGFSGDRPLLLVRFARQGVNEAPPAPLALAPPDYPCAELAADPQRSELRWQPYIAGDFNQDGRVELALSGLGDAGDWTVLCRNLQSAGFGPDTPAGVIDRVWEARRGDFTGGDGVVNAADAATLVDHLGTQVDSWYVYYSPTAAGFPEQGTLLASLPYGQPESSTAGRVAFAWRPGASLPAGCYWVRPVLQGRSGAASPPLTLP